MTTLPIMKTVDFAIRKVREYRRRTPSLLDESYSMGVPILDKGEM
jgi:hypothetical protein